MFNKLDFKLMSSHEIAQELGRRIKTVRLSKNLLQDEVARRAGVSRLTVVHFENTGRGSVDSFLRIVSALGKGPDLSPLFQSTPKTIADMEKSASQNRSRASRKNDH